MLRVLSRAWHGGTPAAQVVRAVRRLITACSRQADPGRWPGKEALVSACVRREPAAEATALDSSTTTIAEASLAQVPVVYFHWVPDRITILSSARVKPFSEPPEVVTNAKNRIAAIGQEAQTVAKEAGMRLTRFRDVAAAWQHKDLAAALLSFYWLTVDFQHRSTWAAMLAGWWPPLRSYLIVHPADGAERGLEAEQARWLRNAFRHAGPRRTFIWSGSRLDPAARLRDVPGRGRWLGGEPPMPV